MLAFSRADFRKMPPCLSLLTPVVLAIGRAGTERRSRLWCPSGKQRRC